jgi:membrane-bound ClpP family serine protease
MRGDIFTNSQVFQILNIIPCLGNIAALVLSLIGAVIGIREASEFSTGKAVLTGIVAFVILMIVRVRKKITSRIN